MLLHHHCQRQLALEPAQQAVRSHQHHCQAFQCLVSQQLQQQAQACQLPLELLLGLVKWQLLQQLLEHLPQVQGCSQRLGLLPILEQGFSGRLGPPSAMLLEEQTLLALLHRLSPHSPLSASPNPAVSSSQALDKAQPPALLAKQLLPLPLLPHGQLLLQLLVSHRHLGRLGLASPLLLHPKVVAQDQQHPHLGRD